MRPFRIAAVPLAATAALVVGCAQSDPAAEPLRETGTGASAPPATATGPARPRRPSPSPPPAPPPLPGLPAETAGFMRWERLNRAPIPPDSAQARRVGVDAHRGAKNVYVRVPRGGRAGAPFPDGTVVVKAAGEDPRRPTLVAVMRKVAGADPEHGDWRFAEYTRAAPGERFGDPLTGAVCWGCHAIAADTDWVFTTRGR
jgi:hypothetical protein